MYFSTSVTLFSTYTYGHLLKRCKCTQGKKNSQNQHLQQAPLTQPASMLRIQFRGTDWLCQAEGMSLPKRFHRVCVGGIVSLLWTGRAEVEQSSKLRGSCYLFLCFSLCPKIMMLRWVLSPSHGLNEFTWKKKQAFLSFVTAWHPNVNDFFHIFQINLVFKDLHIFALRFYGRFQNFNPGRHQQGGVTARAALLSCYKGWKISCYAGERCL